MYVILLIFDAILLLLLQSSVFWYTSRIQDDGEEIHIQPRCFDHHSDCERWAREGANTSACLIVLIICVLIYYFHVLFCLFCSFLKMPVLCTSLH